MLSKKLICLNCDNEFVKKFKKGHKLEGYVNDSLIGTCVKDYGRDQRSSFISCPFCESCELKIKTIQISKQDVKNTIKKNKTTLNKCDTCNKELIDFLTKITKIVTKKQNIKVDIWIKWEDEGCGKKHLVIDSFEEVLQ